MGFFENLDTGFQVSKRIAGGGDLVTVGLKSMGGFFVALAKLLNALLCGGFFRFRR